MSRRIAIIAPNHYPRTCGVGDHSMRLAKELMGLGLETAIFTRGPAEPNPEAPAVPVFGCRAGRPMAVARDVFRALVDWEPTAVVLQYTPQMFEPSRFGSLAVPLLLCRIRRRKVPVTVLAHEIYTPWSARPDLALGAVVHRLGLAALLAGASDFAVTTDARKRRIERWARFLRASGRLRVLRVGANAIPPAPVQPAAVGLRVGTFSSMAVGKRFDALLQAFAIIGREEPAARLVLIGDLSRGDGRSLGPLLSAIRAHPFSGNIELTGKLPLAEVSRLVSGLTVYFHPDENGASTRSGTLPLALGAGVPVVALRGKETDRLFSDGDNVLFSSLAPASIAEATLRIFRSRAVASRLADGGQRLYAEYLSWPAIASALLDGRSMACQRDAED